MKIFDFQQYTAEWWEARRGVPTASEFHRIISPKKWEYAAGAQGYIHDLIAEVYDPMYGRHDQYASRAMAVGTHLEPEARRFYEFSQSCEVQQVGFCLTDDGRFGCSPDALVGEEGGLELKGPAYKTQVKWLLDGGVPPDHLAQCHGFLIVTGRPWIDFLSYCPPLPSLFLRVERDDRTEALGTALRKFCAQLCVARDSIKKLHTPAPSKTKSYGETVVELSVHEESPF